MWLNTCIKQCKVDNKNGKITPKHSQSMRKRDHEERCLICKESDLLSQFLPLLPWFYGSWGGGAPTPIESGEILLVPHHLKPPISGKNIPPISVIGNHAFWLLFFTKNIPFPGLSREIYPRQTPPKYPIFRDNGNTYATPHCIRGEGGLLTV